MTGALELNDNQLTGPVPSEFASLASLSKWLCRMRNVASDCQSFSTSVIHHMHSACLQGHFALTETPDLREGCPLKCVLLLVLGRKATQIVLLPSRAHVARFVALMGPVHAISRTRTFVDEPNRCLMFICQTLE